MLRPYAEHAYAALRPVRGQAHFDDTCPLSGSVEPPQFRFDARLFRFGKLHPDPYVGFVGGVYANPSFFQICEQVVRCPADPAVSPAAVGIAVWGMR